MHMERPFIIASLALLLAAAMALCGCGSKSGADLALDRADAVIEERPDSAMAIIDAIDTLQLTSGERRARYAQLKSMALDKNYIDLTTMDVLQPAIDYYIDKGKGADTEQGRTYYYMGRIHQNAGKFDEAMKAFVYGSDKSHPELDKRLKARLLIGISTLEYECHDLQKAIAHLKKCIELYSECGDREMEWDCLTRMLTCATQLGKAALSDSLINRLRAMHKEPGYSQEDLSPWNVYYSLHFGDTVEINKAIGEALTSQLVTEDMLLDLALASLKIGKVEEASEFLKIMKDNFYYKNSPKFWSVTTSLMIAKNAYKEALEAYVTYNALQDSIDAIKRQQELASSESIYQLEINHLKDSKEKEKELLCIIIVTLVLLMGCLALAFWLVGTSMKKKLAEKSLSILQVAHSKLVIEHERDELEKQVLSVQIRDLEEESRILRDTLETPKTLDPAVEKSIKERVESINRFLGEYLTGTFDSGQTFKEWAKRITADNKEFMTNTRLAFNASHPNFIGYLEEHGLTEKEINYVCLYAIGLRGKEVGHYLHMRSHYNISSEVRKKLGLDSHNTNLAVYIPKLLRGEIVLSDSGTVPT